MTNPARAERAALCDTLEAVGPDTPTLCEGWTARDLAAHLVIRDRRPDALPGVLVPAFAGYTTKLQQKAAAKPWPELVATVRSGPPAASPTRIDVVDRLINTVEYFVHHEDLRRAVPGWEPRELAPDLELTLGDALSRGARLLARRAPVGVVLAPTGRDRIVAKKGSPAVIVRGDIGELVLFLYGRQDHARVDLDGADVDVEALRQARFGV